MRYAIVSTLLLLCSSLLLAGDDPLRAPANGPRRDDPGWHALVGVTLHAKPGAPPRRATVVIRDGEIVSTTDAPPPAGARVWNLDGLHVYAAFVDPHVEVDAPRPPAGSPSEHWCPLVTPARSALDGDGVSEETAKELRELGFGAAALAPRRGVFRGTGALVALGERGPEAGAKPREVYAARVYHMVGFDRREEDSGYPDSLMGAIALVRQTLSDADWLGASPDAGPSSLRALLPADGAPLLFDCDDELNALRAAKLAAHANRAAAILGSGTEFRRLEAIHDAGRPVVVPLAFPKKPRVETVGDADAVDLRTLMTWEQAPTNPRRLDAAGVDVSLTTSRLEKRRDFPKRLRLAIDHGLGPDRALAMLTVNPAKLLAVADRLGTVERGRRANLQVTDGPLFDEETRLRFVFVEGRPHQIRPARLTGVWRLTTEPPIPDETLLVFDDDDKLVIWQGEAHGKTETEVSGDRLNVVFDHAPFGDEGRFVLNGTRIGNEIRGVGVRSDGRRFRWRAALDPEAAAPGAGDGKKDEEEYDRAADVPEELGLPFGPYALIAPPEPPAAIVVREATIWTSGPAGTIEDGVLVAEKGKVTFVGPDGREAVAAIGDLALGGVEPVVIHARGKHVTPGIIDCHSHTGISGGVNEAGKAVTAEVRIADVTNPDDVNWYRQLAGGTTVSNSLHGSANPIGGQSQTVRHLWGAVHPDDMHFPGAAPGIKFALGENVKQSNWGEEFTTRYPQTRMGVETLIRDRFLAARDYAERRAKDPEGTRRDFELQALAEVLAGKRFVHCHSYRQDEILMLCRVAEDFGFRIGAFQHVLEGYKVAEAIKAHAIGASAFSDWWAYKVEVQDAIPYAGAIMHEVGVNVSYNSDSNDLARRLNTEAAKAVKYGGVAPEEALKFVTLNPAVQLGIDHRVGSLEKGKDADFVIWSGPPLSTLSRCESTWIEGREYFSLEKDRAHRERIAAERRRLVQKVLAVKDEGGWDDGDEEKDERPYSCHHDLEGGAR